MGPPTCPICSARSPQVLAVCQGQGDEPPRPRAQEALAHRGLRPHLVHGCMALALRQVWIPPETPTSGQPVRARLRGTGSGGAVWAGLAGKREGAAGPRSTEGSGRAQPPRLTRGSYVRHCTPPPPSREAGAVRRARGPAWQAQPLALMSDAHPLSRLAPAAGGVLLAGLLEAHGSYSWPRPRAPSQALCRGGSKAWGWTGEGPVSKEQARPVICLSVCQRLGGHPNPTSCITAEPRN